MALNHLALCTHDAEATNRFYTEAMNFKIVGIEADDQKGNKYKHVFFDAGDGSYLAFYDLGAFGARRNQHANTNITEAMGVTPGYMHVAWEAHDEMGLETCKRRWLDHGLEVMESRHHKGWMHSIYTYDPNGLMVECAYVTQAALPEQDAIHAHQIFVQKKAIDDVGYEREGIKPSTIHLPNPAVLKPPYYVSLTERILNIPTEQARDIPLIKFIQH